MSAVLSFFRSVKITPGCAVTIHCPYHFVSTAHDPSSCAPRTTSVP